MCVIFMYLQEQKIKTDRDLVGLAQWLACPPLTMVSRGFASRSGHTKDHYKKGTNCLPAISWDQSQE